MQGMGHPRSAKTAGRMGQDQTRWGFGGIKTGGGLVSRPLRTALFVCFAAAFAAACGSAPEPKAKFSPKKYGVKASPRMVDAGKPVPKGGGRYVVGKKYKIAGKWYYPKHEPNYKNVGLASWYGPTFHGRKTANGEIFDRNGLTAAHTTMPLPSYARVTNVSSGKSMIVRVNDRGPFHGNRIIDLSERVATLLGTKQQGVGKVKVEYLGKARLDGQDEQYLLASLTGSGSVAPGGTLPGTLFAQAEPAAPVFGFAPAPAPRPYIAATALASAGQGAEAAFQVAFDPAIAFEAGESTIQIASANTFTRSAGFARAEGTPAAIAPQQAAFTEPPPAASGTLGVLRIPQPSNPNPIVLGSAISSYTAHKRIDVAHAVLKSQAGQGIALSDLRKEQGGD